jgi:hypothetical protein
MSMVNGRVLIEDGQFVSMDIPELVFRQNTIAARLMAR